MPFTFRRYDLDDFEDFQRLRKVATYIRSRRGGLAAARLAAARQAASASA